MVSVLQVVLVAVLSCAVNSQDCSELQISDLGDTTSESQTGLLADTLRVLGGDSTNRAVQILEFNTVCLSQGALKDTYTRTSVVVRYTADGVEATSQVEYQCIDGVWEIPNTGTPTIDNSPIANLTTPVRTDCILCSSSGSITDVEHCAECNVDPACVGLMSCTGTFISQTCCNYFDMTGSCVTACPANSSPDDDFDCVCDPGYNDTDNICMEINECTPNPCENGGTCIDLVNAYSCACVPGYTDDNCTTNIDECSPDPCENGGTCTDLVNAYSCACLPGYTDDNCATSIDSCTCENGGTCRSGSGAVTCECPDRYTGDNCETELCGIEDCIECSEENIVCVMCEDGFSPNEDGTQCVRVTTDNNTPIIIGVVVGVVVGVAIITGIIIVIIIIIKRFII